MREERLFEVEILQEIVQSHMQLLIIHAVAFPHRFSELILEPGEPFGVCAQTSYYFERGNQLQTIHASILGRNDRSKAVAELFFFFSNFISSKIKLNKNQY